MYIPFVLVLAVVVAAKPLDLAHGNAARRHHNSLALRQDSTTWTDTTSRTRWSDNTSSTTWTDGTATVATTTATATTTSTVYTTPVTTSVPATTALILATTASSQSQTSNPASATSSASTSTSAQSNTTRPTPAPAGATAPAHPTAGLSAGAIAGTVVSLVVVLAALLAATLYYRRRRPLASGTEKATLTCPSFDTTDADAADPFRAGTPSPLAGRAISPPLPLQPRVHASSFSSIGIGTPPPPLGSWRPRGHSSFGANNALSPPAAAATTPSRSRTLGPVLQRA
ncbi:uncharacterized protein LOC62_03G003607 [Vanrija pseudolonga]|uniref:Mid2 domain-containing protein n=1 Tax=Vanrija pseudolonga TaxID=143232 RepID=A0AAF1BGQ8_9TREE|nr:hypothetical protein LOC62_03G003607 [Vanrija pseudolonga]